MNEAQPPNLPCHFTASGLVLCAGHVLLVNHRRIGAWVPPGGHVEPDELPHLTVLRELEEETGLVVEILSTPYPTTTHPDACFLCPPLYMQSVSAIEKGQHFIHIDLAYLCRPAGGEDSAPSEPSNLLISSMLTPGTGPLPPLVSNGESKEARWVKLSETGSLNLARNVPEALSFLQTKLLQESSWQVTEAACRATPEARQPEPAGSANVNIAN